MVYRIPDHIVDEVRTRIDIVDLVSEFLPLKKKGKNYFGMCPFHQERSPSFSVNPERQIFHCFGCGKGGNVFTFLMEYQRLSFSEALTYLAEKANVALPKKARDSRIEEEFEALFQANQFAADFYCRTLLDSRLGAAAQRYLAQRGFSPETIRRFFLGYAPSGWSNLLDMARKQSIPPEVLQKAGLAIAKEKGAGYYDRFRDRVVFPIINLTGKVVGFGGRIMTDDADQPKYLNSPETPIYNKGKLLYGLFQAKGAIREADRVVIVEGYTDMISLFQAGIENVVASSGTAFTSDQARLISRYSTNVILLFDADAAGQEATLRGVETLLENGLDVDVVTLPPGTDPDSFVREQGTEAFRRLLQSPRSFIDFIVGKTGESKDLKTVRGTAQAVERVVNLLAKVSDEVKQSLWMKQVSERFGVAERVLQQAVLRARGKQGWTGKTTSTGQTSSVQSAVQVAERGLLQLILADPSLLRKAMEVLPTGEIADSDVREVAAVLYGACAENRVPDVAFIIDRLSRPETRQLVSSLSMEGIPAEEKEKLFEGYVRFLQQDRLSRELDEVREALKKAQQAGSEEQVTELMARFQELSRRKEDIRRRTGGDASHS